jgi:hypothetical protein
MLLVVRFASCRVPRKRDCVGVDARPLLVHSYVMFRGLSFLHNQMVRTTAPRPGPQRSRVRLSLVAVTVLLAACSNNSPPAKPTITSSVETQGTDSTPAITASTIAATTTIPEPTELVGVKKPIGDPVNGSSFVDLTAAGPDVVVLSRDYANSVPTWSLRRSSDYATWNVTTLSLPATFTPNDVIVDGESVLLFGESVTSRGLRPSTATVRWDKPETEAEVAELDTSIRGERLTDPIRSQGRFLAEVIGPDGATLVESADGLVWNEVPGIDLSMMSTYSWTDTSEGLLVVAATKVVHTSGDGEGVAPLESFLLSTGGIRQTIAGLPDSLSYPSVTVRDNGSNQVALLNDNDNFGQAYIREGSMWKKGKTTFRDSVGRKAKLYSNRNLEFADGSWFLLGAIYDYPAVLRSADGFSWKELAPEVSASFDIDVEDSQLSIVAEVPVLWENEGVLIGKVQKTSILRASRLPSPVTRATSAESIDLKGQVYTIIVSEGSQKATKTVVLDGKGSKVWELPAADLSAAEINGKMYLFGTVSRYDPVVQKRVLDVAIAHPNAQNTQWSVRTFHVKDGHEDYFDWAVSATEAIVVVGRFDRKNVFGYQALRAPLMGKEWSNIPSPPKKEGGYHSLVFSDIRAIYALERLPMESFGTSRPASSVAGAVGRSSSIFAVSRLEGNVWVPLNPGTLDVGPTDGSDVEGALLGWVTADGSPRTELFLISKSKSDGIVINGAGVPTRGGVQRTTQLDQTTYWWDDPLRDVHVNFESADDANSLMTRLTVNEVVLPAVPLEVDGLPTPGFPQVVQVTEKSVAMVTVKNGIAYAIDIPLPLRWQAAVASAAVIPIAKGAPATSVGLTEASGASNPFTPTTVP